MTDFILNHAYSFWFGLFACLGFVALIARFGIRPVARAIDLRESRLHGDLEEAARAKREADEIRRDLEARMADADRRVAEVLREAHAKAEADRERQMAEGHAELAAYRERMLRDIDAARQEAVEALREEIAEISVFAAGRILDTELDADRHRELVSKAIASYADEPEGT